MYTAVQRGARAKGIRYERAAGRELRRRFGDIHEGQWFACEDSIGRFHAQTDYYIETDENIILFECKLSQTVKAITQIEYLYKPILRKVYGLPVVGILVCKNVFHRPKLEIGRPEELLGCTEEDIYLWQWVP